MVLCLAYTEAALAYLDTRDKKVRGQIVRRVEGLRANPHPQGIKRVLGIMDGIEKIFRQRSGDYRILYSVRGGKRLVVLDINHRKQVYR